MTGLLQAEVRKLWTVRTTWALTAIGLVLVVLSTSAVVFGAATVGPQGPRRSVAALAIEQIGGNSIIVLVIGLLIMTTEFRHATIGRTLQLTPSRTRVLVAKLSGGALYAAAFFAASVVVVMGLVAIRAALDGTPFGSGSGVITAVWQGLVGMVLTGLLGVAVGALIRSQVVAITVSLVWLFLVENLATALRPEVGRWLPFQALNALFLSREALANEPGIVGPLAPGLALAVFLGYVVVASILAGVLLRARDV